MKTTQLQSTINYSSFVRNEDQRPINSLHVKRIAYSIRKHGYLPSKPVQVYQNGANGKFIIIDGHHRVEAARLTKSCVFFVVEHEDADESMADVNITVSKWKNEDFVRRFVNKGIPDYITLDECVRRGVPLRQAASMLIGETAGSGNFAEKLRDGTFKVKSTAQINDVLSLIEGNRNVQTFKHSNFIKALSMCLFLKEFDFKRFSVAAKRYSHMIPNYSNCADFLKAIEEVYNYHSANKIPLTVTAQNAAKSRSASNLVRR